MKSRAALSGAGNQGIHMTFRELVEKGLAENPVGQLMLALGILRTVIQQEPATFPGVCESANAWLDLYERADEECIRKWLDDLGEVAGYVVPDELIERYCEARRKDKLDERELGSGSPR